MIAEIGHYALVLALALALIQSVAPIVGARRGDDTLMSVAGTTALHNVYTGNGPSFLGVSHYSQIQTIPVAGQVLGPAFPGLFGFLAPRFFSLGLVGAGFTTLISVSLTMTYLCLDMFGQDWHFTKSNKKFQVVFALWIAIPALLTPFWVAPALQIHPVPGYRVDLIARLGLTRGQELYGVLEYVGTHSFTLRATRAF